MNRLAAVLSSLLTACVLAAPAPLPKPPVPWVTGWKPWDPNGDCHFHRSGERLTIAVPGGCHTVDAGNAPRLMRDVEGDFVAEVRVDGISKEPKGCLAGLLILDGEKVVEYVVYNPVAHGKAKHLRIERRGASITVRGSRDGRSWDASASRRLATPRKLKVGVVAECDSRVGFTATFDRFRLTPLGAEGKPR